MSMRSFKAGAVTGGTWAVTGSAGRVRFLTSAAGWNTTFTGHVRRLKAKRDLRCGTVKAASFGRVTIACLDTGNNGEPFGLEADTFKRVTVRTPDTKRIAKRLDDPLDSFGVDDLAITLV